MKEAFEMVDDICWEWEQRCSTEQCSILLELDNMDFFEGVAELVGTEQNDSMNAATVDMVTPTAI